MVNSRILTGSLEPVKLAYAGRRWSWGWIRDRNDR